MTRIATLALVSCLAFPLAVHAEPQGGLFTLPDGFTHQPIASGVANPNGFAFLPDGRVLVTEQKQAPPNDGKGFVYLVVGTNVSQPILVIPGVDTDGPELGLQGIAVDPEWPARPFIYVHYTAVGDSNRVRRYTAGGDLSDAASMDLTLGEPYEILVDLPGSHQFHNGGTLRFGPDGMLYVSHGDDVAEDCADHQDPSIWKGVLLRLDVSGLPAGSGGPPDKSALVPPGNPWDGPTDNARLTYAVGLRNPFRFSIDPVTEKVYIGDVGESSWEELDEATGGDNFGWPQQEGVVPYPPGAGCGDPGELPIAVYGHTQTPNAIIAGPRYRDTSGAHSFGPAYYGDVFYVEFYEGWLRRLKLVDGLVWQLADPVAGQPTATEWATGLEYVSDLQTGPDGALYYVRRFASDFFGRIVRDSITVAVEGPNAPGLERLIVAPRPLSRASDLRVAFEITAPGRVTVDLYDVTGRHVRTIHDRATDTGYHQLSWRPDVEPGIYFLRTVTPGAARTLRLPVLP